MYNFEWAIAILCNVIPPKIQERHQVIVDRLNPSLLSLSLFNLDTQNALKNVGQDHIGEHALKAVETTRHGSALILCNKGSM